MSIRRTAAAVLLAFAFTAGADDKPRTMTSAQSVSQTGPNTLKLLPAVSIAMPKFAMVPGETRAIHATMTSDGNALSGRVIKFYVNGNKIGQDQTDGSGKATFDWKLPNMAQAGYDVLAKFEGDKDYRSGEAKSRLLVVKGMTETQIQFTTVPNEDGKSSLPIFILHVIRKSDGQKLDARLDVKVNGAVYHAPTGENPKTESPNVYPSGHGPWNVEAQYNGDAYDQSSSATATHP